MKDEAKSGRLAGRESYERVVQGIRDRSIDILIVDDLSRLTRSLGNLLSLYEMLKWYEVELISICDGISSEDTSAKTFFTVKGMVNDFTNDIHAERVIRGMEIRALQGFSCGDHPFGYDSKPTKFENAKGRPFPSHFKIEINEAEAQIVRRIFQMYDIGLGMSRIAKALNEDRVASPGVQYAQPGKLPVWSPRGAQHILRNEKYIGIWKWKKTRVGIHPETRLRSAKERPLTEWVSHLEGKQVREDLRIIDHELWDRVQAKLQENLKVPSGIKHRSRWGKQRAYLPDHPLTGVLECGACASNFQLVGGKGGGYYGCFSAHRKGTCENKATLPISVIEKAVFKILGEKLSDSKIVPLAVARYHKALQAKLSAAPARIKEIEEEAERLEGELKNLINFVIQGNAYEGINTAIKDREARKHRLVAEGHALRRVQPKMAMISEQEIRERMGRLAETVTKFPLLCYPTVRQMFPRKIRMMPKGKAFGGRNLYSMVGRILLNGGLATDFERVIENKKGAVDFSTAPSSSGCEPKSQGFTQFEFGVTNGARTRDIRNHNPALYQLSYGHHATRAKALFLRGLSDGVNCSYGVR